MSTSKQYATAHPQSEAPGDTAAALGAQIVSLLPPLRLHSVSIFDPRGDVQWLSEGALGPDEQSVVEEAIAALTAAATRAHFDVSLNDGRAAMFLAVRTPRATLAGVVMVLMDAKTLSSGNLAARILTTRMRAVLQKIAMRLAPPPPLAATGTLSGIRPFSVGTQPLEVPQIPGAAAAEPANAAPAEYVLDWQPVTPAATPGDALALQILETPPVATMPEDAPALRLRELIRLRPGARTRRYQVVPVAEQERGDALATLEPLLAWLRRNPSALQGEPLSFTIGVSAQALANPDLPAALARRLESSALDPRMIGFELRESACVRQRPMAERLLAQCEKSGCFAVIDDFTFHTAALDLLRSGAVRMLKVETRLVATALKDRLAQARVVAIAQAAKVLGTHCAAKYVDSQAGRRWICDAGFDFTQSSATEPLQRLAEPRV